MSIGVSSFSTAATTYGKVANERTSTTDKSAVATDADQASDTSQASDTVKLSNTSSSYSSAVSGNGLYFPVRAGMNADALALGVSQPGAVSSSKDKTFSEVATDARKRMDEKYALMKDGGKPYAGSEEDRNALMGDLDRRSLYAVATNKDGLFTADEQASANALMRQQEQLATGHYSGPADQEKNYKDPYANDPIGRARAALKFLDGMSPEEKAAPEWLKQHQMLEAALTVLAPGSDTSSTTKKDGGHFHNLAEILAGVDTQPPQDSKKSLPSLDEVFKSLQDKLRSQWGS
ncbi:hypothetical protein RG836_22565 [Pseudomonas sp. SZMC_28357]|uniref:hypothetical protein n=1 Tax=Pseudomonas sp. SZMC_28357 TaxID=3074380 RepID=UPI00287123DD|nr:hypothetical protein [Pseudomonas sp. SZMC_28357]MDR9754242.1 hypothetical protein [Pseudomonas sp. SZMC_28357]